MVIQLLCVRLIPRPPCSPALVRLSAHLLLSSDFLTALSRDQFMRAPGFIYDGERKIDLLLPRQRSVAAMSNERKANGLRWRRARALARWRRRRRAAVSCRNLMHPLYNELMLLWWLCDACLPACLTLTLFLFCLMGYDDNKIALHICCFSTHTHTEWVFPTLSLSFFSGMKRVIFLYEN